MESELQTLEVGLNREKTFLHERTATRRPQDIEEGLLETEHGGKARRSISSGFRGEDRELERACTGPQAVSNVAGRAPEPI